MFEDEEDIESTINFKPTYDGRLQFLKALGMTMNMYVLNSAVTNDIDGAFRALRTYLSLVSKYLSDEQKKEIRKEMEVIENHLSIDKVMARNVAAKKLNDTATKIFEYSAHILLPQGMTEDLQSEVDWEKWRGGSL